MLRFQLNLGYWNEPITQLYLQLREPYHYYSLIYTPIDISFIYVFSFSFPNFRPFYSTSKKHEWEMIGTSNIL